MKVDFLIFHSATANLMEVLLDSLSQAYQDNYDEPPEIEELLQFIDIRYSKKHVRPSEEGESGETCSICGFSVDFDAEEENVAENLVKGFCESLEQNDEVIEHVLKLNDPYLRKINRKYADEIFEIEMKLREAISLIFLDTYGDNFYNLLTEVNVKPSEKDLKPEQMQARWENEFFYLLFSDYPKLNERKQPNSTKGLIQLIGQADDYEAFKHMLTSKPIGNEQYMDFLASLQTHVDPIEKLRNCVAHNRAIPQRVIDNYETAKEPLISSIESLLAKFEEDHGMWWEEEAYRAVQMAIESANWNFEDGTVEISMDDCDRSQTCNSYDELVEALEEIANNTAFANMPFEGGEPVFSYDPYSAVESVLPDYEEQLTELGWEC